MDLPASTLSAPVTLPALTEQEVFNKVWDHLNLQGKAAVNGPRCRLRAADGTSCAVGCFIPDNVYDPLMDTVGGVLSLFQCYPNLAEHLGLVGHTELLLCLQSAHDNELRCKGVKAWRERMLAVASFSKLIVPPLPAGAAQCD